MEEASKGKVSPNTQFNYAWCLIRSGNKIEIKKGVSLLQGRPRSSYHNMHGFMIHVSMTKNTLVFVQLQSTGIILALVTVF